jgi:c-di-GMP-binding flagellar brake protein YcgR
MYTRLKKFLATFRSKRERGNPQSKKGVFAVERRRHPRISLEFPLDCSRVNRVDDEEIYSGMIANVSEGGVLVYLPQAMEIGTLLKTEILSLKGLELNTIKAIAKVVWSDLAGNGGWEKYRCGLEFQSFQKGDLHKLKILLKRWKTLYDKVADNVSGYHL